MRVLLAADACLGVVAALLVLAQAVLLARVAARGFGGASLADVARPLELLVVVVAARAALAWGFETVGRRAAQRTLSGLRSDLVDSRLRDRPTALDRTTSAEVATLAVSGVDALETTFTRYLPQLVLALVVPVAVLAIVVSIDPVSAAVMLLTLPLVPLFMWLVGRFTEQRARARLRALTVLSGHFLDVVRGLPTLRAFNRSAYQAERIATVSDAYRRTTMGTLRAAFLSGAILELAATLGIALVAVTVGVRLVDGGIGLRGGADGAGARARALPPTPQPGRAVPRERRRARGRGAAPRPPRRASRRRVPAPRRRRARPSRPSASSGSPSPTRRVRGSCSTGSTSSCRQAGPSRSSGRAGAASRRWPRSCSASRSRRRAGSRSAASTWRPATSAPGAPRSRGCRSGRRSSAGRSPTTSGSATAARRSPASAPRSSSPARTTSCAGSRTASRPWSATAADRSRPGSGSASRSRAPSCATPPLAILDEPTANLDPESAELVADAVERLSVGRTVLLIAHAPELAALADHVVELRAGRIATPVAEAV